MSKPHQGECTGACSHAFVYPNQPKRDSLREKITSLICELPEGFFVESHIFASTMDNIMQLFQQELADLMEQLPRMWTDDEVNNAYDSAEYWKLASSNEVVKNFKSVIDAKIASLEEKSE